MIDGWHVFFHFEQWLVIFVDKMVSKWYMFIESGNMVVNSQDHHSEAK